MRRILFLFLASLLIIVCFITSKYFKMLERKERVLHFDFKTQPIEKLEFVNIDKLIIGMNIMEAHLHCST